MDAVIPAIYKPGNHKRTVQSNKISNTGLIYRTLIGLHLQQRNCKQSRLLQVHELREVVQHCYQQVFAKQDMARSLSTS